MKLAQKHVFRDCAKQYKSLGDYSLELMECNPDSETMTFRIIYVYLGALSQGFKGYTRLHMELLKPKPYIYRHGFWNNLVMIWIFILIQTLLSYFIGKRFGRNGNFHCQSSQLVVLYSSISLGKISFLRYKITSFIDLYFFITWSHSDYNMQFNKKVRLTHHRLKDATVHLHLLLLVYLSKKESTKEQHGKISRMLCSHAINAILEKLDMEQRMCLSWRSGSTDVIG
uniref:Uncharacterized protein n=1 Tax=Lactuca sativa TaxID=4236 RepID=A0A9R1W477_LACSA|nr:hypothetical protein LSAT_V11C300109100 [Lactuca sativa]